MSRVISTIFLHVMRSLCFSACCYPCLCLCVAGVITFYPKSRRACSTINKRNKRFLQSVSGAFTRGGLLGKDANEIITSNKATRTFENKKQRNQYDTRTGKDIVFRLNPFQEGKSKNEIVIPYPIRQEI